MEDELPQVTVRQIPITMNDRKAMLHKHPVENQVKELGRVQIGPGAYIVNQQLIAEVYRYEYEGVVKIYDVRAVKDAIYKGNVECVCLVMNLTKEYVDHVFAFSGCEQEHLDQITSEDIKRPSIGFLYSDGMQLIDGSHRLVARYRRFNKTTARIIALPGELDAVFLLPPETFRPIR